MYFIIFELQKAQIGRWCWGSACGKGLIGGLTLGPFTGIGCRQEKCPHSAMDEGSPMAELHGEPIVLRKLTEV